MLGHMHLRFSFALQMHLYHTGTVPTTCLPGNRHNQGKRHRQAGVAAAAGGALAGRAGKGIGGAVST